MSAVPDRSALVGREVWVRTNRGAAPGPKRGMFLGQGEYGLSVRAPGGGRFIYRHHEVRGVRPVRYVRGCRIPRWMV